LLLHPGTEQTVSAVFENLFATVVLFWEVETMRLGGSALILGEKSSPPYQKRLP